jgi:hypothetical protein
MGRYTARHYKTGEETDLQLAYIIPERHFQKGSFIIMSKLFCDFMSSEKAKELGKADINVMFALLSRIMPDNQIKRFKQKDLGKELGIPQQNISRSIIKLKRLEIISYDEENECLVFCDNCVFSGRTNKSRRKKPKLLEPLPNQTEITYDGYSYGQS